MKKVANDYALSPEQEKELEKRMDEHEKGLAKYIPAKKSMKEIRAMLKELQNKKESK